MTLISKVLPISCAQGSLGLHAFVEKGVWMGEASHLEKLLFILSREAQRAAERRGVAECSHLVKPQAPAPGAPHMLKPFKAGLLATVFEITKCWQHEFDMNMQIRILKSPTSCFWIFLEIQPLTMSNKK